MPDGSCVIKYEGARGVVWRVKYRDAAGRQVKETLGKTADGWTKRKAEAALRARLVAVEKDGLRRVEPVTFATFAREWLNSYPAAKGLKRSTSYGYELIVKRHLEPVFGPLRLEQLTAERLAGYVAGKRKAGLAPRTVNRHLNLLGELFKAAVKQGKARSNPVPVVERPREPRRRWRILSPAEVAAVERAFRELANAAELEERAWREQARTTFLVAIGAGLRRAGC